MLDFIIGLISLPFYLAYTLIKWGFKFCVWLVKLVFGLAYSIIGTAFKLCGSIFKFLFKHPKLSILLIVALVLYPQIETFLPEKPEEPAVPVAEITELSVGYLTESDYNNGDFDDWDITRDAVFQKDSPQYVVIDFSVRTTEDNSGGESIRISPRLSDPAAFSIMIQEAATGKIETVESGNGNRSYDLFYAIPSDKDAHKIVRMILKLTPNANVSDTVFDVLISGDDGTEIIGETHKAQDLHVGVFY